MSIQAIHTIFECDGCGKPFTVALEVAATRPLKWTLVDIAEDHLRAGDVGWRQRGNVRDSGFCSLQGGKHLCWVCTREEDAKHPDDCRCKECERPPVLPKAVGAPVRPDVVARLDIRREGETLEAYMLRKGIKRVQPLPHPAEPEQA